MPMGSGGAERDEREGRDEDIEGGKVDAVCEEWEVEEEKREDDEERRVEEEEEVG